MALGDPYATLAELKTRLGITDVVDDAALTRAVGAASRTVEGLTRRQFNQAGAVSARVFHPVSPSVAYVDDLHTSAGLLVDTDDDLDGAYENAWPAAGFQLEPANGAVAGIGGWPFTRIRAIGDRAFTVAEQTTVRVTASWGWAAVPDSVKEATLILAEELFKMKDAPFGVAGFGEFGPVRVRENPIAAAKLRPYRRASPSSPAGRAILVGG